MISNIVFAIYALRMRTSDSHEAALSNAIFFAALFLMLGIIVSMVFISRSLGLDIDLRPIDDWLGIGAGKVFAFFVFSLFWLILKIKLKKIQRSEIEKIIISSNWLTKKPEVIAFSPLIVAFSLLMLILII